MSIRFLTVTDPSDDSILADRLDMSRGLDTTSIPVGCWTGTITKLDDRHVFISSTPVFVHNHNDEVTVSTF